MVEDVADGGLDGIAVRGWEVATLVHVRDVEDPIWNKDLGDLMFCRLFEILSAVRFKPRTAG